MKTKLILIFIIIALIGAPLAYIIPQAVDGRKDLNALTIKNMVTVPEDSEEFAFYSDDTGLLHADHARVLYDYLLKHRFTVATKPPSFKEVLFKSSLTYKGPTVLVNTDGSIYVYCDKSVYMGSQFSPKWWHYWVVTRHPVFVTAPDKDFAAVVKSWWDEPQSAETTEAAEPAA